MSDRQNRRDFPKGSAIVVLGGAAAVSTAGRAKAAATVDTRSSTNHDNIWDIKPEVTREVMAGFPRPWIAFKVMAAGAIPPEKAFRFAFQGGADFICAGMFDFQVAEDVGIAKKVLAERLDRERPWRT
jgi:hypothetical protein